jgi:nucleoside-diphosphate-sugar epimerase
MEQLKNFYQGKKVLVTGGAGFIGSHLVEKLVALGSRVTVLDNFSNGSITNLKNVFTQINLNYADVSVPYVCMKATQGKDIVFHLAALVSVPQSLQFPEACYKINVVGTQNILEGCINNGVKTMVLSSSCAVYGDKSEPCKEEDETKPLSPYAKSKLASENLCQKYYSDYGLNTVSLRYFNVYGERQMVDGEYAAVIAKFKHNLENKLPITIFGDGSQTRDFVHISEVVDINLKVAMQDKLCGNILNVASGKSISILELIKKLEKEIGTQAIEIKFQPARVGDIIYSNANCEKLKKFIEAD